MTPLSWSSDRPPPQCERQVVIKRLGRADYIPIWRAMQAFTARRDQLTADEFWIVEHPPVFTQGLNGKPEHLLNPGDIPVVQVDRGGQVTYHGPGQVVIYLLIDLKRRDLGPRALVRWIEAALIAFLGAQGIDAHTRGGAPGVYVRDAKIAALGLRVKRGCSYHGLSFNVDMDLSPFQRINPCGYAGLEVTQLKDHARDSAWRPVAEGLCRYLVDAMGYNSGIDHTEANDVCQPS